MAFCKNGFSEFKRVMGLVTAELSKIIDVVLNVTGKVMTMINDPALQPILSLIPNEPLAQAALGKAIDLLTEAKAVLDETDASKKLTLFLADLKPYTSEKQHSQIAKLAQLWTAFWHGKQLTEKEYDTIVQNKILVLPPPAAA